MKHFVKVLMVLGLLASSSYALAEDSLIVLCDANYTLANGVKHENHFNSRPDASGSFVLVQEKLDFTGGDAADLYVYYDGSYAAINVNHAPSNLYLNADSGVDVGKLFTLNSRLNNAPFSELYIACHSRTVSR